LMLASETADQASEYVAFAQQSIDDLVVQTIKGEHHFHMESGVTEVEQYMKRFLLETKKTESAL